MKTQRTYDCLLAYASSRGDQTFSVNRQRLLDWFETQRNYLISPRTLSMHLQMMQRDGLISIDYDARAQAIYRFPDGVVTRQRVKFSPSFSPGVFDIEDDGVDLLSESEDSDYGIFNHNCEPVPAGALRYDGPLPF